MQADTTKHSKHLQKNTKQSMNTSKFVPITHIFKNPVPSSKNQKREDIDSKKKNSKTSHQVRTTQHKFSREKFPQSGFHY